MLLSLYSGYGGGGYSPSLLEGSQQGRRGKFEEMSADAQFLKF